MLYGSVQIQGKMNKSVYKDILHRHLLPYPLKNLNKNWPFQQVNDPKNMSTIVKTWMSTKKNSSHEVALKTTRFWITQFGMNLTNVCGCINTPAPLFFFLLLLHEEWNKFTFDDIKLLTDSMPSRCADIITVKGMSNKCWLYITTFLFHNRPVWPDIFEHVYLL